MVEGWLPQEGRRASWDAGSEQLRVVGWRPGPAGVSTVAFAPGLVVAIDHASPGTVTEVVVDADGGVLTDEARGALETLLGARAASRLAELPRLGTRRPVDLRSSRYDDVLWDHDAGPRYDALVRVALALDLGADARRSRAARAAALLEALQPMLFVAHDNLDETAGRGVDLLAEGDVEVDEHQAHRLDGLVRFAAKAAPAAVSEVDAERARRRLRRRASGPAPAAAPFAARSAAAAKAEPLVDALRFDLAAESTAGGASPRGVPLPVAGDHRGWAWLDRGGNVGVEAGAAAAGAWARVFRRSDRVLLGLAPVRTGLVVIPPADGAGDLEVDLVDDPASPRRAATHDALRAAIAAGREAARRTRLGAPDADAAWQECAARWEALGDVQRANLARRHGRRDRTLSLRRSGTTAPFLADEL